MEFNATEMKELNVALGKAFDAMQENIKKVQDTAEKAREEVRQEGTLHGKTNEALTKLGEESKTLSENYRKLEQDWNARMLDVEQKLAARPSGSGSEEKSISDVIIESDQYKAAGRLGAMAPVEIGNVQRKTAIFNATGQNQPLVPAQRLGGVIVPAERRLYVRDLLPQATTTSNLIEFASEATFTSAAAPQGSGSSPVETEGQRKAESAMTFTLDNTAVITIAHWIPASRQVLNDASMLRGHIEGRLMYGLKLEEEEELLTGNGTAGTLNGLCNQATAYNRGSTNDTLLDTLLKALLQVSLSNYEASGFVLNPVDWYESILLLKDTQNRYLFTDPHGVEAPRVWGKQVVASQTMTAGKFLCGAFSLAAQIWDREDATVRISENVDDHFIRNMVAILVEERLALAVYRTAALVYGSTSHAG
jgi:HK97 family phage major capsid protein